MDFILETRAAEKQLGLGHPINESTFTGDSKAKN
jgi:hypothetical protein